MVTMWPSSSASLVSAGRRVNNDRMPLMELLAEQLNSDLQVPKEGEVVELRFEGLVEGKNVKARLLYAAHGTLK